MTESLCSKVSISVSILVRLRGLSLNLSLKNGIFKVSVSISVSKMGCPHSQSQSQSHKLSFESLNLNLNFIKLLSSVSVVHMEENIEFSFFCCLLLKKFCWKSGSIVLLHTKFHCLYVLCVCEFE